jgi:hypothetical protein
MYVKRSKVKGGIGAKYLLRRTVGLICAVYTRHVLLTHGIAEPESVSSLFVQYLDNCNVSLVHHARFSPPT